MGPEETKVQPQAETTPQKQANCLGCGKPIKKLNRYYRDGKFYCSKKCWKKTTKTKEEKI